jgi:hypothetical protein
LSVIDFILQIVKHGIEIIRVGDVAMIQADHEIMRPFNRTGRAETVSKPGERVKKMNILVATAQAQVFERRVILNENGVHKTPWFPNLDLIVTHTFKIAIGHTF